MYNEHNSLTPRHKESSQLGLQNTLSISAEWYDPAINECLGYDSEQSDGEAPVML